MMFRPEASVQGGITAAMPGGSFCGALVSGYLTDKLGRRRAISIGCLIWIIGSIISCASQNIGMLIAGRFINGVAVGICSAQVPVYVSELAPPEKRGRVVGSQQWAITWGILIMYGLPPLLQTSPVLTSSKVLHLLRLRLFGRSNSLPHSVGSSDDPRNHPSYRSHVSSGIASMACT
jgi:MFS family permease